MSQLITSKEQWDSTPVPQRCDSCHFVGISGKVAGKRWELVTVDERLALNGSDTLARLLGARPIEVAVNEQAEQEYMDNKLVGMRSVANDIIGQILAGKESNKEVQNGD